ncbi:protein-L-isoaspartate(D-aspartate) O-methyltransferase [Stella humosa]|uniref:Protein-L-isoaspartate O-methyltransferase n=2 Tax=Stella humosa TaxID=94 RepID=A0A3N1MAW7_9PROT|nr:protein-L-isoaspartate(D-aspartate) O-methyltransferase [Stella humosa]
MAPIRDSEQKRTIRSMAIDYSAARANMVESQIRPNKVTDPAVIAAFLHIPRERFVPPTLSGVAYVDVDIPIGAGRYLLEPMVLGRLLQFAGPRPTDLALEIGTGTGYGAAVLARMVATVVGVESDPALARQATANLAAIGIDNASVVTGGFLDGCPAHAPYDVILISGAVPRIPAAVEQQLAEGGRLVAVEFADGIGRAVLVRREGGRLSRRVIFDAATPLLVGTEGKPAFVF